MFRPFRTEKKAPLVENEKNMQSTTRPMRGPCTPISLLSHETPGCAAWEGALGLVAAPSFIWGVDMSSFEYRVFQRVEVNRSRRGLRQALWHRTGTPYLPQNFIF